MADGRRAGSDGGNDWLEKLRGLCSAIGIWLLAFSGQHSAFRGQLSVVEERSSYGVLREPRRYVCSGVRCMQSRADTRGR